MPDDDDRFVGCICLGGRVYDSSRRLMACPYCEGSGTLPRSLLRAILAEREARKTAAEGDSCR